MNDYIEESNKNIIKHQSPEPDTKQKKKSKQTKDTKQKKESKQTKEPKQKKKKPVLTKAQKKRRRITNLKLSAFLMPSLIGVCIFYLLPFCVIIFYSFVDNPVSKNFVVLRNYFGIMENEAFRLAAFNTARFSLLSVPLAVVLSLAIAILLDKKIPMASKFRSAYLSPMMVPVASVVLVFQVLFDYNGVVNLALSWFGGGKIDWLKSEWAPVVVLFLFLWKNLGYNMILFLAALGTIPREALEVALLDTTSNLKIFFMIKIRYLSPTILFVAIMSLINSFKVFREVYLLSGSYPYETLYTLQHYMNNMFLQLDYQKMSAAAVLMAIVMVVVIGGLFVAENRFGRDMEE